MSPCCTGPQFLYPFCLRLHLAECQGIGAQHHRGNRRRPSVLPFSQTTCHVPLRPCLAITFLGFALLQKWLSTQLTASPNSGYFPLEHNTACSSFFFVTSQAIPRACISHLQVPSRLMVLFLPYKRMYVLLRESGCSHGFK